MKTVFTAYFSAPYDSGILFVGVFDYREDAEKALKETVIDSCYDEPKILVSTLGRVVNKPDWDNSITAICNL